MNTWYRRAARSVGLAGGVLLLGAGTVQSHVSQPATLDPRQIHGLLPANAPADPARQVLDAPAAGVDGPNMIGDDFVDQSPYAGPLPLAALDTLPGLDILPTTGLPPTGLGG
ncbi:MAG: hypothetical protein JWP76_4584 [Dactylosporangium sp.]|jgi:hypothetical protein|nr:hypothetical protein [Dactylosporangium sp.]